MRKLILLAFVCVVLCNDGVTGESLFASAETVSLWDGGAVPKATELKQPAGIEFSVIKQNEPEKDGYNWLHGVALCWHKGRLWASYGTNRGKENTPTEEAHARASDDGGKTWGPVQVVSGSLEGMEIETFVHGAACMAYSGRCLLSAAMVGRSGNQGECAQPCRWQYHVVEEKRPGEYWPVCEDDNGTYIFSAKDLCLMPVLPQLIEAGIASLKIEGRMKTEYYVATVTAAYRRALDLYAQSPEDFAAELPALMAELSCASHRESDTGFALEKPQQPGGAEGFHQDREFIARAVGDSKAGECARFVLKNRFYAGDRLELLTPDGIKQVNAVPFLREKTGEMVDTLGVGGETIAMQVDCDVQTGDILRGEVRNHRR